MTASTGSSSSTSSSGGSSDSGVGSQEPDEGMVDDSEVVVDGSKNAQGSQEPTQTIGEEHSSSSDSVATNCADQLSWPRSVVATMEKLREENGCLEMPQVPVRTLVSISRAVGPAVN